MQWLEQDFLKYLASWELSVEERPGYSKTEKGRMLLSPATRLGIRMTCTCPLLLPAYYVIDPSLLTQASHLSKWCATYY